MPKVSVYLSDELYAAARSRGLSLSALTRSAVEQALTASVRQDWIARMADLPRAGGPVLDTGGLLSEVREEFGS
jgi:post-segregation antitoxin (ccd killing protein)